MQRHRYVKRMESHSDRISKVKSSLSLEPPVAAFGNGKYRTPQPSKSTGKVEAQKHEAFREVREAFRRVRTVTDQKSRFEPKPSDNLAQQLSRNRRLGSRQSFYDDAHNAELYHLQRRIENSRSLTERKKNKLDPDLYPVVRMRNVRSASAAELLDYEASRRAGLPPRPRSARAAATSVGGADDKDTRPQSARERRPDEEAAAMRGPPTASAGAKDAPRSGASARGAGHSKPHDVRGASGATTRARGKTTPRGGGTATHAQGSADVGLGEPTADVNALRRRLLEKIVDQRLFREAELRPYLATVVRHNTQFDAALLKEAVRDVEREFYLI